MVLFVFQQLRFDLDGDNPKAYGISMQFIKGFYD